MEHSIALVTGEVAKALFAAADEFLASAPQIQKADILAEKLSYMAVAPPLCPGQDMEAPDGLDHQDADHAWKPRTNPWVIALTVTLATFMEVLDTSIANVSLPHIGGASGATQNEAAWVLTSYLVANAIVLPAAAYLATFIGRKKFYMICVALFGFSSMLCGLAPSLPLLVFFRVLQGAGGGGLAPSEQAILADTFSPKQRGQAFALYGVAVVMAPAIGPLLGGWITDNFTWRWIFFINVPVTLLSLYLVNRLIEDPPNLKREVAKAKIFGIRPDLLGFGIPRVRVWLTRIRTGQGSGRRLVRLACHSLLHYSLCRFTGYASRLGSLPVEDQ